ncbi:thyrotropin-releasing hormone receptor-like [Paramacrobiotus metropolitanus]|uniref:thyrotropin-releasing hormone receptor-like n=1 Tax=Paramacrobiotus metropolitanus TaxID=2943436 RepID=UPI0024464EAB|nr:thyrotropin-releasing hormone receptor-like [Paramacrobiotus metropolitanus]
MNNTTASNNVSAAMPVWNTDVGIFVFLSITGLSFNGILVVTFLVNRHLWRPFNIYLFNLLFANLLFFITVSGFNIVQNLYGTWLLNSACCTVYLYGGWVVTLVQSIIHPLIASNRIWALWAPISYRHYHGYQAAIGLCMVTWICAHIIGLWGVLTDHLYYRKFEETHACQIDTDTNASQRVWMLIMQFISLAAVVTIVVAFPLIVYKDHQRKKIREGITAVTTGNGGNTTEQKPQGETGRAQSVATVQNHFNTQSTPGTALPRNPKERPNAHTLLLFVLTVSVFIFWSPSVFYYAIIPFTGYRNPTVENVVMIMFNVQSILDPILFTLTLHNLRNTVISTICFWKRCLR